jgi:hypothetical protein
MKLALLVFALALSALAQSPHSVVLKWTDGINPTATTYNVYRSPQSCAPGIMGTKINSNPITLLTWTDPTVVQNTTYCYTVRAYLNSVESVDSTGVTATIPADLFAPSGLSAVVK